MTKSIRALLLKVLGLLPLGFLRGVLYGLLAGVDDQTRQWTVLAPRPRLAADAAGVHSRKSPESEGFAVVLQGPVAQGDDFTLETVRLYRRTFPGCMLIVSTWADESPQILETLRSAGAAVVTSPKPEYAGMSNINFQITSAGAGVRHAASAGTKYVLKSRTDQRLFAGGLVDYLRDLQETFPLTGQSRQQGRVIGISRNTYRFRLYGLSDMNVFGKTQDMLVYWQPPLDTRKVTFETNDPSMRTWSKKSLCEVYLASQFLTQVGRPLTWTLEDSWRAFAEHFLVVDEDSVDLFWPKYGYRNPRRYNSYDAVRTTQEMTFRDWVHLYRGGWREAQAFEAVLDLPFEVKVPDKTLPD